LEGKAIPELSKLIIEVDSRGLITAKGNLDEFAKMSQKAGKGADDVANKMGALQLIANKLPGPLKSVAAGLMGMVNPTTAVAGVVMELGEAAARYIGEAINLYAEHEAQLVRLGAVLKATGAESWTTTSSLSKYANELQSTTGKSSDEIMRMQSVLLGFTSITGDNFNRLTKNMLDMVDVMGGDMVSAANTFGKAMDNPAESLSALSRYGFKFTEEEKNMIKAMQEANDIAGAQVVILKSMEKAFGGAAEAHAKTLQGMKEYIKTLKEQHKALQAEVSGIADISKMYYENRINHYSELNENLSRYIELQEIAEKKNLGTATLADQYREEEIKVETLESAINRVEKATGIRAITERMFLPIYEKQLEKQRAILATYESLINYDKQRLAMIENQVNYLNKLKNSYNEAMSFVNEIYSQTTEGQIEKIQEQIDRLTDIRNNQKKVEVTNKFNDSTKQWVKTETMSPLSSEEISKIDKAIESLISKINNMNKIGTAFKDWEKVLAKATGYSENFVHSLGTGLKTVERYAVEGIIGVRDRFLKETPDGGLLYEMLGLNRMEVFDEAEQKMRTLVQIMTEARIEQPWDIEKDESYQRAIAMLQQFSEERGKEYIASLAKELKDAGKSTYELAVKRLMLEQNITKETAQQAISIQKQIDYVTKGYDFMGDIMTQIDDALRSIRSGQGGYGQYIGGKFTESGMNAMQGSDVGNFAQGMAQGGWQAGLINMFIGALAKAVGGMETFSEAMNPITGMFEEMETTLKSLLAPALALSKALVWVGRALDFALQFLTLGTSTLLAKAYDLLVETNDERQEEADRLRALNEQYKNLMSALKEQEEYYLQQRRHLNAEWAIENFQTRTVNDMILSPHGAFSTDPEDYIIATKHPENLTGNSNGGGNVYVNVINNSNAEVSTRENVMADGSKAVEIIINGVKREFVNGGFDGVMDTVAARRRGKGVSG
jgi:hypothetical protein